MFSPATKLYHLFSHKDRNLGRGSPDSPSTPAAETQRPSSSSVASIPNRPSTGTPAPWASRLSVLASVHRIPSGKRAEKSTDADQLQPVYVGEFPQVVRSAQASLPQKSLAGKTVVFGGMDKRTFLSWIICGNQLFVWSYLSTAVTKRCVVLEIPSSVLERTDSSSKDSCANHWMASIVPWDIPASNGDKVLGHCDSAGIVLCDQKTQAVIYWPNIYSDSIRMPNISFPATSNSKSSESDDDGRNYALPDQEGQKGSVEHDRLTSLIASELSATSYECIGIACQSNGDLWRFSFSLTGIYREKIYRNTMIGSCCNPSHTSKVYARSLVWRFDQASLRESGKEFFLLTDREIQCWTVMLAPDIHISKLWTHEIVGDDGDLGIKKDLAGQKNIWLLDMQVDDRGKEFTLLVATLCKDRVSSSNYTQYSLLTMQHKPGHNFLGESSGSMTERVLEKKAPLQIIIPKARVEDDDFLLSMRLRIGGKPSGSTIILAGDGTATVTNYWRGSTRLYQFDLPWDAWKVLDASVFPSSEGTDEGSWVVLTEKAGIWAIPEKAVLFGAVEPPERSLSRKGSSNEGATEEEKRSQAFGGNIIPRRASSEAWSASDRQRTALTGIAQRTAQDEEAEALLGRLFHDFLLSSNVEGAFEKLKRKGAFDKEGETNVFARLSKSIVDTLAKHWTTTRGEEFVASAVISSLLLDKQQKHQKYLQFLALSKCHEELALRQRYCLLTIMEHGEKLSGVMQLRELQNLLSQNWSSEAGSPKSLSRNQMSGSLWTLIQLVGEKARRNTVLLMDRDNAEVFYSKVSHVEEFFYCLTHNLQYIVGSSEPFSVQIQRAYELSNATTTLVQTAMHYRDEHQTWYPSPEGLTPWNCQPVVRSGLWSLASYVVHLLKEAGVIDAALKVDLCSQLDGLTDVLLEAYTGAITAKIERSEEHKGLVEEYCRRREELLGALYEQTKRAVDARYQDTCMGVEDVELKEAIYREVSSPLLSVAKRHEGYQALWHICYDLNDTGLLRSLMHDSVGPKGGFCNYVFKQLIQSGKYAKLLRLGEEFQDELASFLKDHKYLLWLHEIFLHQFSSASESLHSVALTPEDGSMLLNEDEPESAPVHIVVSLEDRKRLLNLSKIAAVAGRSPGFEMKTKRIDADLHILKLQEIVRHSSDAEEQQSVNNPMPPEELIEMCLKGEARELTLLAFEVLAWTSASFRNANRILLEECWRKAADQDDWAALCQASTSEGWSDEVTLECLRGTVLFKAANRCYGSGPEAYEGSFEDVLPLKKEDADIQTLKDPGYSVEGILMQHKDFPDAGKLMLTAVMLGKAGTVAIAEEDTMVDA